jgi:hypothetical protein
MHHPATAPRDSAAGETFSVRHLFMTLRRYLPAILLSFLAVMIGYTILALALYVSAPTQTVTTLQFRLEFNGAEEQRYPNGTRFSPSDILNTPTLARVFDQNDMKRFMTFAEFKSQLFIVESNRALESLAREYQAKLADPKLSPIDRDRLEREYDTKSKSLAHNDYAINFVRTERLSKVPPTIIKKVLNDVLVAFAEQAMKDRGGLDYRVPVVTRAIFADINPSSTQNVAITTDMLRTKIRHAIGAIDTLLEIPGTDVLRTEREQISLPEVRGRFEDILRFNIQPLTRRLAASTVDDRTTVASFMQAQLEYNSMRAAEARKKEEVLKRALVTYQDPQRSQVASAAGSTTLPRGTEGTTGENVTPQLTESFIDRLVQLSTQSTDLGYRQRAVDDIIRESMALVPFESEIAHYENVLSAYATSGGVQPVTEDEARRQLGVAYANTLATIDQLVELYRLLSKNLNPGNVMYTTTAPPVQHTERTMSLMRLGIYGVLVGMLSLPLIIAACLIHNRMREENEEELAFEQQPTQQLT